MARAKAQAREGGSDIRRRHGEGGREEGDAAEAGSGRNGGVGQLLRQEVPKKARLL